MHCELQMEQNRYKGKKGAQNTGRETGSGPKEHNFFQDRMD